jgi:hypothetical protein
VARPVRIIEFPVGVSRTVGAKLLAFRFGKFGTNVLTFTRFVVFAFRLLALTFAFEGFGAATPAAVVVRQFELIVAGGFHGDLQRGNRAVRVVDYEVASRRRT